MDCCSECKGFLPAGQKMCPNCGCAVAATGAPSRRWLALVGSVTVPFTLMACYGVGPYEDDTCALGDGGVSACPADAGADGGKGDGGNADGGDGDGG